MSGWICLHRGYRLNDAFEESSDPFHDEHAWVWLLEHAAWRGTYRRGGKGDSIRIERGQIHVSDRQLAAAWHWDKKRVHRFLDRIQLHGMVAQERDHSGTILTICNYEKYQQIPQQSGPSEDQPRTTQEQGKQDTSSNELGVPPADTAKAIFDHGVALLAASGHDPRASRSIVGRWRKDFGDGLILQGLLEAKARAISNPVEWMPRWLAGNSKPSGGNELDALIRQGERFRRREAA